MKYILLPIAMVIGSVCWGQKKDTSGYYIIGDLTNGYGEYFGYKQYQPKQDTVKVLMLICDTSSGRLRIPLNDSQTLITKNMNAAWWQFGYEVCWMSGVWSGDGVFHCYKDYLDQNKKPISKSLVVWLTKEIK